MVFLEAVSYKRGSTSYTVEPIDSYDMIDRDISVVIDLIEGTPLDGYRSNMETSVDQGLAYAIFKDNLRIGFVYNRVEAGAYLGSSIFINKDLVAMNLAMKTMFEIYDARSIRFTPHQDNLRYFKSMVRGTSIRAYYSGVPYVTIIRDDIIAKGKEMFFYLGLEVVPV